MYHPGNFVPVFKIEGNVPHLRAKFAYFVGHLPTISGRGPSSSLFLTLVRDVSGQNSIQGGRLNAVDRV
jgi:hypothetical protein